MPQLGHVENEKESIMNGHQALPIRLRRSGCGATRGPESNTEDGREKAQESQFRCRIGTVLVLQSARIAHFREDCQRNDCQGNKKNSLLIYSPDNHSSDNSGIFPASTSVFPLVEACRATHLRGYSVGANSPGRLVSRQSSSVKVSQTNRSCLSGRKTHANASQ